MVFKILLLHLDLSDLIFITRYPINSDILHLGTDPRICSKSETKMLSKRKIKDIEAKACFRCTEDKRAAFILESPNQHTVLESCNKQDLPVASVTEEVAGK